MGMSTAYAAPDTVIECVALAGTCAAPAPVTEYAPTAANAAPDTVIECVAPVTKYASTSPASAYAALVPVTRPVAPVLRRPKDRAVCQLLRQPERWGDADMSESMSDMSEEVDEYEARCDDDASPKSTCGPLETMHTDTATVELGQEASDGEDSEPDAPYSPELDTVFDALVELAGEDGRDWVPVRQIQAQTSLRLERLEDLLEEWECMGVICMG